MKQPNTDLVSMARYAGPVVVATLVGITYGPLRGSLPLTWQGWKIHDPGNPLLLLDVHTLLAGLAVAGESYQAGVHVRSYFECGRAQQLEVDWAPAHGCTPCNM